MHRNRWLVFIGLLGLTAGLAVYALAAPPLVVDKSAAPLLLDEPKPEAKPGAKPDARTGADNEPCFVCHGNYREEPLARRHAKEDVGCMKCHGSSAAHRGDEDNITPPDIIYALNKIDRMCQECHAEHNVPARKVVAAWQKKCPQKTDAASIVCTDCHGAHRLAHRTVPLGQDHATASAAEGEAGRQARREVRQSAG